MLGPVARTRALLGAAVLATAATGSVVLASGSAATPPEVAPRMGPFAAAPPVQPLIRLDGPLLPQAVAPRAVWPRGLHGPRVTAPVRRVGPSAVVVGPGSSPAQVRRVQRLLNRDGAGLRVDGAWGPATTAAVRAVQARSGLPVDGRVGPATAAALAD